MSRRCRRTWAQASKIWAYTAAGLLGSILTGALIAEYAVGQISPIAQASDRVPTLRENHNSSGSIVPQMYDADVARAIRTREDQARNAALARASDEMSRKIEADALRAEGSAATLTTSASVAEPLESPADPPVSDPPPTYRQDL